MKDTVKLRGGRLPFIATSDSSIDWEASDITPDEYLMNPFELCSSLKALEGEELTVFHVRIPTTKQLQFARMAAGIRTRTIVKDGVETLEDYALNPINEADPLASLTWAQHQLFEVLARVCVKAIEGPGFLPDATITKRFPHGLYELKPEVVEEIEARNETALLEIGSQLMMELKIEGKTLRERMKTDLAFSLSVTGPSQDNSETATDFQPALNVSVHPDQSSEAEKTAASFLNALKHGKENVKP